VTVPSTADAFPQQQLRGNLPQAFVHALMLECSARLAGHPGAG
jgi:hypothetical protein